MKRDRNAFTGIIHTYVVTYAVESFEDKLIPYFLSEN
jgi:hypothetical protein